MQSRQQHKRNTLSYLLQLSTPAHTCALMLMMPQGAGGSTVSGSGAVPLPPAAAVLVGMALYSCMSCSLLYKMMSRNWASGTGCTSASENHLENTQRRPIPGMLLLV